MSEVLKKTYTGYFDPRSYISFITQIYQVSQNITNNTTYAHIKVTLHCTNGASYYLNSDGSIVVKVAGTTVASNSGSAVAFDFRSYTDKVVLNEYVTFSHNSDGTFNKLFTTECDYGSYSTGFDSSYVIFDTIPRESEIGAIPDFNLEDTFSVPVTKYSGSFTDDLLIKYDDILIKTITNYTNNADINLTDEELLTAYNAIDKSATFTFETTTKNDGTQIGTDSATATGTAAGTGYIKVLGEYKRAIFYIKVSGTWEKTIGYIKESNTWKRGVG